VSGHGNSREPGLEGVNTFSFHAVQHKDGRVTGSAVIKLRTFDFAVKVDIQCVSFLPDGRTAALSGTITKSDSPGVPFDLEGLGVLFYVRDNGEGAGAPPDEVSDFFIGAPPLSCQVPLEEQQAGGFLPDPLPFYPVELGGNVQVRP
jgi:hypothetical protein